MEINLDEKEVRIILTVLNRWGHFYNKMACDMAQKTHPATAEQANSAFETSKEMFILQEKIRKETNVL